MEVIIYTKDSCPFCVKAKEFFDSKQIPYQEKYVGIDITSEEYKSTINDTVPGIFVNGQFIGGYTDLIWVSEIAPAMFTNVRE